MKDNENIYIYNLEDEINLDKKKLSYILDDVKNNLYYGDIVWPNFYKPTERDIELIEKIEEQLIENNRNYSRFPNDYIHCLFSKCVYRNDLELVQKYDDFTEWDLKSLLKKYVFNKGSTDFQPVKNEWKILNNEWKILKIRKEYTNDKFNNIPIYTAVLFVNESRKQLVLSHKGLEVDFKSLTKEQSEVKTNIQGIILNQIVPQLAYCYEFTEEANKIARDNNYYLSFTGYSNGAWLSENSLFYSNKYFKNVKTKAVLFDGPGMVKSEDDIRLNIINRKTSFDLKNLNIVNYLTAPSFSNSCNKHIGNVHRVFFQNDNEFRKSNKWLDFMEEIKQIPIIGNKLFNKNLIFFLDGLYCMFDHGNLDLFIEIFDKETGRPTYYEEVEDWPFVKLTINQKDYENNLKEYISSPIEKLVNLIPIPDLIKKPGSKILSFVFKELANMATAQMIPGVHLILNILIELEKGNIDLEQFENAKFYKKITEKNEIYTENTTKRTRNKKTDEFTMIFKKSYKTNMINQSERVLVPNSFTNNNDHLLWCLFKCKKFNKKELEISNILYKLLNELKTKYNIKKERKGDNEDEFILKTIDSDANAEEILERFIRLNQLSDFKLGENLSEKIKQVDKKNPLQISSRLYSNFNSKFIQRSNLIKEIVNNLNYNQGAILHAFGGCGKSRLAFEIGNLFDQDKYIVRLFDCETKEKLMNDYNQLYKEIFKIRNQNLNNKRFEDVIQEIKNEIIYADDDVKLLYIMDNVENFDHIKSIIESLPYEKTKFLITTRNKELISSTTTELKIYSKEIDLFNENEIRSYLDENLKRKDLNEEIINKIIRAKMKNNQILPLDLYLTVNYIKECVSDEIDELLKEIIERSNLLETNSGELKEHSLHIEQCLFQKLKQKSMESFKLLAYCAYLDPDSISYNLINLILNVKKSRIYIKHLTESGLISKHEGIIKIHRLIQDETKFYLNKTKELNLQDLVKHLIEIFLEKIETIDNYSLILKNSNEIDSNYTHFERVLEEINESKYFNLSHVVRLNIKYANYLFYKMNYQRSKEIFLNVYLILRKENELNKTYLISIIESLRGIFQCFLELDDLIKSLEYLKKFYHRCNDLPCNELKKYEFRSQYYYYLGKICEKIGKNERAFEFYEEAFKIHDENSQNNIEIVDSLNALSKNYETNQQWEKALKHNNKAYEQAKRIIKANYQTENHPKIAEIQENYAGLCKKLGKIEKAKKLYQKSINMKLKIYENNETNVDLARSFELIANLFKITRENDKELVNREKCVSIKNSIFKTYNTDHVISLILMAKTYEETNNYSEAEETYQNIYKIIKKNKNINKKEINYLEFRIFMCKLMKDDEEYDEELYEKIDKDNKNHDRVSFKLAKKMINKMTNKENYSKEKFIIKKLEIDLIISVSGDNTIKIWNIESGECLKTLVGHTNFINVVVELKHLLLASGSDDNTIKIWNIESGECLKTLTEHEDFVNKLLYIQNGLLISSSFDNTIKVWNIETGQCLKTLVGHTNFINDIIIISNNLLASGSDDNTIKIWNIESGECLKTLVGHEDMITILFKTTDNILISGSADKSIKIWNIETNECLSTLLGHSGTINYLVRNIFDQLISVSSDKTIKIWNLKTSECLNTIYENSTALVGLSDKLIAFGSDDYKIKIFNIETSECCNSFSGHLNKITSLILLQNNLLASGSDDNTIKIWNIESGECLNHLVGHSKWIKNLIPYPNSLLLSEFNATKFEKSNQKLNECLKTLSGHSKRIQTLFVMSNNLLASGSEDSTIRIWNIESSQCLKTLTGHQDLINRLIQLSDKILGSASDDKTIKIWNIETGECLRTLIGHEDKIKILIAPLKNLLASGSLDKMIKIWCGESFECLKTLIGHSGSITCLTPLSDNKLASGSADNTIKIWNLESGECIKTLNEHSDMIIALFKYKSNQLISVSSDKTIRKWNLDSGECFKTLSGHTKWIKSLTTLKNNILVSGSDDHTIKLWNLESDECIRTLTGHSQWVNCLVSIKDYLIISASWDNTIKVWNAETGECLNTFTGHYDSITCLVKLSNNLIASGSFDNTIKVWNVCGFLSRFCLKSNDLFYFSDSFDTLTFDSLSSFNSDFQFFIYSIVFSDNRFYCACSDCLIRIYSTKEKKFTLVSELFGHSDSVRCLSFLNSTILISSSDDGTLYFWDIIQLKPVKTIRVGCLVRFILKFTDDYFFTSSDDFLIKKWDYKTGKHQKFKDKKINSKSHLDEINSLIFLSNNELASGSLDRTVKVWIVTKRNLLFTIDNFSSGVYSLLYISKDNKNFLVSGCYQDIYVNEIVEIKSESEQYKLTKILNGHSREVTALKMLENNTQFASGSIDTSFAIWNI